MSSTYGRSYWNCYTATGSGGAWELANPIYRPNANLKQTTTGTVKSIDLADGSRGLVIPEVPVVYDPITFDWDNIASTDTFLTTMRSYVNNATILQIVDHLGNQMYGVWSDLSTEWQLDTVGDYYTVTAQFIRLS
jgi:hypothetical protein